ncbi:hypothetical protein BX616_002118 [Lobosporangium transversale]|uniref:Hemerythrin-like domain-containing protein n=1 Tax=Lobosporangium transversale TaxID=64571 RepID=A0A1Y2G8X3_9FUNG|nr:hypothetical protein BCR41DRAFT_362815 [Lobosporangium transversale]KAF9919065.1 hypothetical protein BX616_002118 [Lobosporangium transversale]ORZ04450.1 hypothetical protein BCR41DRAFT_362815 [Lobosporangium transversale]|eukprot:XP_021876558.1 hypothetical protein BCR41DRAFT_362815 [Lobosporangium transversale]
MSRIHQAYFDHLVAIHNHLRHELKSCLRTLPTVSQPASVRNSLRNVLQFCRHLQGHHDLEEQIIFPVFAAVTDISHWSHSHEELEHTLGKIREMAQKGLDQDGKGFSTDQRENIVDEMQKLSDIVLPHLSDEEHLSHPDETIKLWPTERELQRAFPWMN